MTFPPRELDAGVLTAAAPIYLRPAALSCFIQLPVVPPSRQPTSPSGREQPARVVVGELRSFRLTKWGAIAQA